MTKLKPISQIRPSSVSVRISSAALQQARIAAALVNESVPAFVSVAVMRRSWPIIRCDKMKGGL